MSINRIFRPLAVLTTAGTLLLVPNPPVARVAAQGKLAAAKSIRCTFPILATGSWKDGKPEGAVKPANLVLEFESINTDEGSAQLNGGYGTYDIIVRLAGAHLHFIQAYRDGPLYSTTVFDKESSNGKLKAVHSRHEYYDTALPGFTSSPEQYYGECEVRN
jgi:hypothetical protein